MTAASCWPEWVRCATTDEALYSRPRALRPLVVAHDSVVRMNGAGQTRQWRGRPIRTLHLGQDVERASLHLLIDAAQVFAENAHAQQLHAPEKEE